MSEELNNINCPTCGIAFGIAKAMEKIWKESHKSFFCPNGHSMSWPGETPSDKEARLNKEKIVELEAKLATALTELEDQKKKTAELTAELDIWKPSTTE